MQVEICKEIKKMRITKMQIVLIGLVITLLSTIAQAQVTGFTYQGRLNASGNPASGTYEMQFQLYDSATGGAQVGPTLTDSSVTITGGVFTTTLDFGASFDGSARYLEIGVRSGGSPDPFTQLSPRQAINYVPHAIRSLNAGASDALSSACVDCVTSAQVLNLDGAKITGEIPTISIPTGSDNYIQNASVPRGTRKSFGQPAASLNIGGNATVGSMDVNGPVSLAAVGAPAAAPAGQGRIYFDSATNKVKVSENGSAFVNLVGATGVSGSGTVNSIPMFTAGTTLGSSLISQIGGTTVQLPAFVNLAATASGNAIGFGSPNSGTGMTISGPSARGDLRLDSTLLRLTAGLAGVGPPGNGIAIDTAGNVGISNLAPLAKLDIGATGDGAAILRLTTERPWLFRQVRTGPSTGLQLQSLSGSKKFEITTVDGFNVATFLAEGATSRVGIGTTDPVLGAALHVIGTTRSSVVEITGGSDLAEKFSFSEPVTPGMVVAIDAKNAGKLKLARGIYNRQVAGVISGANNLSAGMTLPDVKNSENGIPVALSGRVWVYADATKHAITPGDLLTTATVAGHAMKATNYRKSQGAIIGKAMTSLKTGRGLVLVLVSLQ